MPEIKYNAELFTRLPLPLAQLYEGAYNAKSVLERHNQSYYLWEASLKLLASSAIAAYAEHPEHDPEIEEGLKRLARPLVSDWWGFTQKLVPILARRGDEPFIGVNKFLFGAARRDLPRASELDKALGEVNDNDSTLRQSLPVRELFDRLIRYRNDEIAHGAFANRETEFLDRLGKALFIGVTELLSRLDPAAGGTLTHVGEVKMTPDGGWQAELTSLNGEGPRRVAPLRFSKGEQDRLPVTDGVYLKNDAAGTFRPVHPLVIYQATTKDTFFLNARREKKPVEYLCYRTGEHEARDDLGVDRGALLGRVLGAKEPVKPEAMDELGERMSNSEPPPPPRPPRRTIGGFELISELGRGGMGIVYRALQPSTFRQVALKCLKHAGDVNDDQRFAREIRALGRVEHPHLVKIYASGTDGDELYYAMELVDGTTLEGIFEALVESKLTPRQIDREAWRKGLRLACEAARAKEKKLNPEGKPVPPGPSAGKAEPAPDAAGAATPRPDGDPNFRYESTIVDLMLPVIEATHALHAKGVIHRDIKPGNVMVTADGEDGLLMDLGLAQMLDEESGRLTKSREFFGTIRYASPEQLFDTKRVSSRSDVYSLGATLWEMLTLQPIYVGKDEKISVNELIQRINTGSPERVRTYFPMVSPDLEAIVEKCLQRDPKRRYSASELADDLGRWKRGECVHAQPLTAVYFASKLISKHREGIAAVGLLAAFLIAAGAVSIYQIIHQHHEAEENLRLAKRVVRAFSDKLTRSVVINAPGLEPLRADLLETARSYYSELAERGGNDPSSRADLAEAYYQMGLIHFIKNDLDPALNDLETSKGLREKLATENPRDPRVRLSLDETRVALGKVLHNKRERGARKPILDAIEDLKKLVANPNKGNLFLIRKVLADAYFTLGWWAVDSNEFEEAESAAEKARETWSALVDEDPADYDSRVGLARSLNNLGRLNTGLGQTQKALGFYKLCRDQWESVTRDNPGAVEPVYRLARLQFNLGLSHAAVGESDDARKSFGEAARGFENLFLGHPAVPIFRTDRSYALIQLGNVALALGDTAEAMKSYAAARETFESVLANGSKDPNDEDGLAASLYNLGSVSHETGAPNDAKSLYGKAVEIWVRLDRAHPKEPDYQRGLARTHLALGRLAFEAKRYEEADSHFHQSQELWSALMEAHPRQIEHRLGLASVRNHLAVIARTNKNAKVAAELCVLALAERAKVVKERGDDLFQGKIDLGESQLLMGDLLAEQGDAKAIDSYKEAATNLTDALRKEPRHVEAKRLLAEARTKAGAGD